jgi:hypothetical protein
MKKTLGLISTIGLMLLNAGSAMADVGGVGQAVPLSSSGFLGNIQLQNIPQFIITLLLVVGVLIALIFLIYGGIKWILSGGDKAGVEAARKHIVAAIVGLVIVVAAFFIINVVFTVLGVGSPLSGGTFCIPSLTSPTCGK